MAEVTIYGYSDDLVEVDGDLSEELSPTDEHGMSLAFGDGTILDVHYDSGGIWRVTRAYAGSAQYVKQEAAGDDGERDDGRPAYSEIVTLTGELLWMFSGERVEWHKIPKGAAAEQAASEAGTERDVR